MSLQGTTVIRAEKGKPVEFEITADSREEFISEFIERLEDELDLIEIEKLKGEKRIPAEQVYKRLNKKHGLATGK
jgi:hypothetical protein